jgi:hypothetical protein
MACNYAFGNVDWNKGYASDHFYMKESDNTQGIIMNDVDTEDFAPLKEKQARKALRAIIGNKPVLCFGINKAHGGLIGTCFTSKKAEPQLNISDEMHKRGF